MKINDIYLGLHNSFYILFGLSLITVDYIYLPYVIVTLSLILIGWIINYNCFLREYERFISCFFDNEYDQCNHLNKDMNKTGFEISRYLLEPATFVLILFLIRYYYKYNVITFDNPLYKRIIISIFILVLNILFLLLIIPVVNYYKIYNNKKQLYLYIIYYLIIIIVSYHYYKKVIIKE